MAARALENQETLRRVYNLGSSDGVSVSEIMTAVARVTRIDFTPDIGPRRVGDPARIVASGALAEAALDWHMRHTLDEMVASAWTAPRGSSRERL